MKRPAIFFDKDGTLIEDVPYNVDPALIRFMPGARQALRELHKAGYLLFVVSNQSGIARGYFPESALVAVEQRLRELMADSAIPLAGFYYCPHYPDGVVEAYAHDCACRKPEPGLILQAADEHRIDLAKSWFIGDILNDIEAGHRAGCKAILIDNGNETEWQLSAVRTPDYTFRNLAEAASFISGSRPEPCSPARGGE